MRITEYVYMPPPRPENAVMPTTLKFYETRGWFAQVKKNGTCSVIYVPSKGEPFAKTRHIQDPEHKVWAFSDKSARSFKEVRTKGLSVYVAELMHSKGNGIRDTNYIHDVLVYDGESLMGWTYQQRHELLQVIFKTRSRAAGQGPESHWVVNENTWVAKTHTSEFKKLFERLGNEDEGLVLKDPKGVLSARDNSGWQVKCRRPHKNYGF